MVELCFALLALVTRSELGMGVRCSDLPLQSPCLQSVPTVNLRSCVTLRRVGTQYYIKTCLYAHAVLLSFNFESGG